MPGKIFLEGAVMENQKIVPFLTFTGRAEEAMVFYADTLPDVSIVRLVRYGKDHPFATEENENYLMFGELSFMGGTIMFLDMDSAHPAPNFSWASSIYIDCRDEGEFDAVFDGLSAGGLVMMGPEAVGELRKCAWVTDKFGVTWQPVWQ